ncbi:MAG: hypothetical protein ABEJ96_03165, partial [Thiohalorhabdaceae bacterium]
GGLLAHPHLGANAPGFREMDPYAPSSPYAASKASSDHLVRVWGRMGVHAGIDWTQGHTFLDKELQQIVQEADSPRRYADKLVRVYSNEGDETWVLIHVEVQGDPEPDFAGRMYQYHYRLFDRYNRDVVSLAVLADADPGFRPHPYQRGRWGCQLDFQFPTAKLIDWLEPEAWAGLEASFNIFAPVVMAQIRAKTTSDLGERQAWKFRLVRNLYDRGYSREVILELFRIIDWLVQLPEGLEKQFLAQAHELEEEAKMPFVAPAEKIWKAEGKEEGKQEGEAAALLRQMERKFGPEAATAHRERIEQADSETLLAWLDRILTAEKADEIFQ